MSDIVIRVENLSKQYKLGATLGHDRLKDLLTSSLNGLFSRRPPSASLRSQPSTLNSPPSDYIWALKDISFEVKQGEVLGIIGPNGAGKSTLLKILSRITEPTSGRAEIYGRVGSLLEVGTGFDRELTGRENIYLNGAVLGMTKREITRKFDEIVDFSGVEKFIDTPVKRYSSGMYVRLAFAVAAHLEPEILIVDEVLAVGDASFQQKCLGKMREAAKKGRTVLFVSHNMDAIQRLCQRAILLERGKIIFSSDPQSVVDTYFDGIRRTANHSSPVFAQRSPFTTISMQINGQPTNAAVMWRPVSALKVSLSVDSFEPVPCPRIDIAFYRMGGLKLFAIQSDRVLDHSTQDIRKNWTIDFLIDRLVLAPQTIFLDVGVRRYDHDDYLVLWQQASEIIVLGSGLNHHVTNDSLLSPNVTVLDKLPNGGEL